MSQETRRAPGIARRIAGSGTPAAEENDFGELRTHAQRLGTLALE
jgi:hypothetical protein